MPLPVVICAMPGLCAMASMMLVDAVVSSSRWLTIETGVGDSRVRVPPVMPVTTTSSIMALLSCMVKSACVVVVRSICCMMV